MELLSIAQHFSCSSIQYVFYLLSTYGSSDTKFPPELWASTLENSRRMNNAAEAFHSQFNAQF